MAHLMVLHDQPERLARTAPNMLARPAIANALVQATVGYLEPITWRVKLVRAVAITSG